MQVKFSLVFADKNWNTISAFWDEFGGIKSVDTLKSATAGGADDSYWRDEMAAAKLFRITDASGKVEIKHVKTGGLRLTDLDSNVGSTPQSDVWN